MFYDLILFGNCNIFCVICYYLWFGIGDGVFLVFGEGGIGLGLDCVVNLNNMLE